MKMQKKLWQEEYKKLQNLPSSRTKKPSKAVVWFINEYISPKKTTAGKALDMGSGLGRNAIYLAEHGYHVTGVEMVRDVIVEAKRLVKDERLQNQVNFIQGTVGEPLGLPYHSYDLIIDMMTMHLLSERELKTYVQEVSKLLKKNGYFLFYTISFDDPSAKKLIKSYPGPEKNTYIIPQSGIIEHPFSQSDLSSLFPPFKLKIVRLEKQEQNTYAFGRIYKRIYYLGLLQKL